MTAVSATARVPTGSASRYLQQLCKHWQHGFAVTFTAEHGEIIFPRDTRGADWAGDAQVTFDAEVEHLRIRIDASEAGQLEGITGAVESHLDRFAFREASLSYRWERATSAS